VTVLPALWAGLASAIAPGLRVMLRRRQARGKELPGRLAERWGEDRTPRPAGRLLWLHAASVGETVSVLPVLAALPADLTVLMTTGTVTSAALLNRRLAMGLEQRVLHRFVPLDVPGWVARFLDHWRPDVAAFVESELWPNMIAACRSRGVRLMLVNARMSVGSFRWWRRAPGFARRVLGSFESVRAQSSADAERLVALGARGVSAPGDLKFAALPLPVDGAELERLRGVLGERPVWLAASTHPGEEEIVIEVHRRLVEAHPGLVTVIAPRHPERGADVAGLAAGLSVTRRSLDQGPPEGGIWVADTLGELGLLYRLAGIAFVGRSLAAHGGQNPLEPARLGCAVAVGPHVENFIGAVGVLDAAGALAHVSGAADLAAWVDGMLRDPAARAAMGRAAEAAATRYEALPAETAAALLALFPAR
jgi:3-deoxy-D-manno-octulosonic-acid transferase